jgi:LacI family transcriptional regulator
LLVNTYLNYESQSNSKQIAKELNVSVSTVSKALNDSPEISDQTKIKIKEYAKLKNYKPNVIGLKNRKNKNNGVLYLLFHLFSPKFCIEKVADEKGTTLLYF